MSSTGSPTQAPTRRSGSIGPKDELAAAIAEQGPYDLIVDYLWGAPAEAVFAALARPTGKTPKTTRYISAGMSAGEEATLPAMALRRTPVHLAGSGTGRPASLAESAAAFDRLVRRAGEFLLDAEAVPLADVEKTWSRGDGGRVVFVP